MSKKLSFPDSNAALPISSTEKSRKHPLFGRLKGTFTIDPSWDLTQPAMPEWADMIEEKYGSQKPKP